MGQPRVIKVGPQGRIVIPAELRRELGVSPGDELLVSVEDGRLVLGTRAQAWRKLRGMGAHLKRPGESVVDELIADRRREFEQEERDIATDAAPAARR